ncbi:uncharacterised protein [Saccharolobus solfataricus]|uniref:Universal stress protein n=1 Tax=Saccharolobus solfataricus TaxID=2287 RepID=A0A157SYY7_SACSO|nr:uncharacterised protein [Saccharolobus solfataricus]
MFKRILVGFDGSKESLKALNLAHHFKSLAENLQKKYPRRILHRISSFHQKAKRIMEDFSRKVGC